jgi:hypothetical protein
VGVVAEHVASRAQHDDVLRAICCVLNSTLAAQEDEAAFVAVRVV